MTEHRTKIFIRFLRKPACRVKQIDETKTRQPTVLKEKPAAANVAATSKKNVVTPQKKQTVSDQTDVYFDSSSDWSSVSSAYTADSSMANSLSQKQMAKNRGRPERLQRNPYDTLEPVLQPANINGNDMVVG